MGSGLVPYKDLEDMAVAVVQSGMFPGIKTPAQAKTLFMIAQAEGKHPITALMEYDFLPNGKLSLKNSEFMARFQARGGQIEVIHRGDDYCELKGWSSGLKEPVTVKWTKEESGRAGLSGKVNHKQYPADMNYWRCVYRLVSIADPGAARGFYPSAVAQDFEPRVVATEADIVPPEPPQEASSRRVAGGEAEGVAVISGGGSEPEPEPPVSIFDAPPPTVPGHCTMKGCKGEIHRFNSRSKAHPGREYWACEKGQALRDQALCDGSDEKTAAILSSSHFRQWVE